MSLELHKRSLQHCTFCPKLCRFCCPTAEVEHKETVTPWGKMSLADMLRQGWVESDEEISEVFHHCFLCLHCRTHCKHGVDVPAALLEARESAYRARVRLPAVDRLLATFRQTGNPFGRDLRAALVRDVPELYQVEEAQAVLFPGCQALAKDGAFVASQLSLFSHLAVDHLAIWNGPSLCCGAPLWQIGATDEFKDHARRLRAELKGVRQIICSCPTCAHVLKTVFPTVGVALSSEIRHWTEFVAPLLAERKPRRRFPGQAVYHDPCYLTRYLGHGELVRRILEGVLAQPLSPLTWSGMDAVCCGGGGAIPHVLPEVARGAAELRQAQLRSSGAEQVLTACPGCVQQLGSVNDGLPVRDLTEVLLYAYGR